MSEKEIEKRFVKEFGIDKKAYKNKFGATLFLKACYVVETLIEREQQAKRYIEETKALTREQLEQRILDLILESEKRSLFINTLLESEKRFVEERFQILEEVKKSNSGLEKAIGTFNEAMNLFVEEREDALKFKITLNEMIEENRKLTETLNAKILSYNDMIANFNEKYVKLLKRVHREAERINRLRGN